MNPKDNTFARNVLSAREVKEGGLKGRGGGAHPKSCEGHTSM